MDNGKIIWNFVPPEALHFVLVWERLADVSRRFLFHIAGSKILHQNSFMTIECQIESFLNTRPMTSVSTDIIDIEFLRENFFSQTGPKKQTLTCAFITRKLQQENCGQKLTQQWCSFGLDFSRNIRQRCEDTTIT